VLEPRIGYAGYVRAEWTSTVSFAINLKGSFSGVGGNWWLARNRFYDPISSRWINRDPAGYIDGLSMYLYVRANPWGLVDPMGLRGDEPEKAKQGENRGWLSQILHDFFVGDGSPSLSKGVRDSQRERNETVTDLARDKKTGGQVAVDARDVNNAVREYADRGMKEAASQAEGVLADTVTGGTVSGAASMAKMGAKGFAHLASEAPQFSTAAFAALFTRRADKGVQIGKDGSEIAAGFQAVVNRAGEAVDAATSFSSFRALKKGLPELPPGQLWHHIVEQSQGASTRAGFTREQINSVGNVVAIPAEMNNKLAAYYNSTPQFTGGQRVRNWLGSKSWEEQTKFGMDRLADAMNGRLP
ncbi:MAG: RHS repeat-associated core domain-containing protein, partial [Phycisphaerales bacterium]|nr:RHS repeat-associated core domain-containing protein [Phycisphaerales bacterium]